MTLSTVTPAAAARATSSAGVQRPSDAVVWVWRSINAATAPAPRIWSCPRVERPCPGLSQGLTLAQRAVLANQQIEVGALLVRELQEDPLAFGVLEALAVALEELVRPALALDADEQRLLIVDALAQLLGAFGEQPVRRALEKQERRPRFELRILGDELGVALLERAEMLPLLGGQPLEDAAAARIARSGSAARV